MNDYQNTLDILIARCKTAGIKYEKAEFFFRDPYHPGPIPGIHLHIIDGEDASSLSIAGEERVKAILSIPFEKYRVIYKYLAICSYKDMYLEANATVLNAENVFQPSDACTAIFGKWDKQKQSDPSQHFVREFTHGASDKVTRILLRLHPSNDFGHIIKLLGGYPGTGLVIQVWSPEIKTYERTVRLLDSVVSSLFFQIDNALGVPLRLTHPDWRVPYPRRKSMLKPKTLRFSFAQYEQAPLDLYWYARSADRMPLLQYLAFYQVLEYFMPSCSQRETISKVRELLAGPTFNLKSNSDIVRIMETACPVRRSLRDERQQLRAVLKEFLAPKAVRDFIAELKMRREYFEKLCRDIAPQRITVDSGDDDLIQQVTTRLHQIRCRIVHTKDVEEGGEVLPPLIPFSVDEHQLQHDIDLIQCIARTVLAASSTRTQEL
ncbi:MAG: hypothetical protein NT011_07910 [Kiritimatiellaeota bacterium]|nr:hypothetical protein [Kiritimatiellota bacterium]